MAIFTESFCFEYLDEGTKLINKKSEENDFPLTNRKIAGVRISIDSSNNVDRALDNIENDYPALKSNYGNIVKMIIDWYNNNSDDEYNGIRKNNLDLYDIVASDKHTYEFLFDLVGKTSGRDYSKTDPIGIEVTVNNRRVVKKSCHNV